jgi:hypothetical protein
MEILANQFSNIALLLSLLYFWVILVGTMKSHGSAIIHADQGWNRNSINRNQKLPRNPNLNFFEIGTEYGTQIRTAFGTGIFQKIFRSIKN